MMNMTREALLKKTLFFFMVILAIWTATKIPYFIGFNPRGTTYYDKLGIEGSINLVHWIHTDGGYHGNKLKSPRSNFFLVHIVLGMTVLVMIAFTLINSSIRRRYGVFTNICGILLALHSLPASMLADRAWMRWVFSLTCIYTTIFGFWGLYTLSVYDRNPARNERLLRIQHWVIAFAAWGGGFAEIFAILEKVTLKQPTGRWVLTGDGPHPRVGTTPYDWFPESIGWTFFWVWVVFVWILWPVHLVTMEEGDKAVRVADGKPTDTLPTENTKLVK